MDKIKALLESKDVEMVRLGALLIEEQIPRKEWKPYLSTLSIYHHLSIKNGHIIVRESDWITQLSSYNFIIIDFDELNEMELRLKNFNVNIKNNNNEKN